jgi:DNA-binding NtrC family response regulator
MDKFEPGLQQNTLPSQEGQKPLEDWTKNVLLLDDDADLRDLTATYLKMIGCTVEEFDDGEKLIKRLENAKLNEFGLVITDKDMPKRISGLQVIEKIRNIDKKMPVILYTGGGANAQVKEFLENSHCVLLQKPFLQEDLTVKIREALAKAKE